MIVSAAHPTVVELCQGRYLIGVIQHGGFRSAARELGVAQPTLPAQIRQLEFVPRAYALGSRARGDCRPHKVFKKVRRADRSTDPDGVW
ncbi:MAG: LysR family transcriptional regulator [Chloroflexi bacterium]|nr:LysR family transcriptional regulator [Chloroflexota bacterium]